MAIIIAEAGVNHNGDIAQAKQLIDVAAEAGADFVKFQTFSADRLVSPSAQKAAYQRRNGEEDTQYRMLKRLELNKQAHYELRDHCRGRNIRFLSTAFDLSSLQFLVELELPVLKIPSGELTNLMYLEAVAQIGKPVIMSTGMATLGEIEAALGVLSRKIAGNDITVLHCNTQYPTPFKDVNLRAMRTIASAFDTAVGYSDHTRGIEVPIAAVALGAVCIEKHFTLDRNARGPDHAASLEPNELKAMVKSIRNVEMALGNSIKAPTPSERDNIPVARKSIHLKIDLPAGHRIRREDLMMLRPGDGISPMYYHSVVGRTTADAMHAHAKLAWKDLR